MRNLAVLVWLLCSFLYSPAQSIPTPSRVLTDADGLPQSYIQGMAQDVAGFVWIATKDGLARYDGRKMKRFRHRAGDPQSLADNVINYLYLDRSQRLWLVYGQGDIDVLDTRTEAVRHLSAELVYRQVKGSISPGCFVAEDSVGRLWVRSNKNGITAYCFDLTDNTLRAFRELSPHGKEDHPYRGFAISGNRIWTGTINGLGSFSPYDEHPVTVPARLGDSSCVPPVSYIWPVSRGGQEELLVFGSAGIGLYAPASRAFTMLDRSGRHIYTNPALTTTITGDVYVSANDTIFWLTPSGEWSVWRPSTSYHEPVSLLADRSGVLWVGGNATGIQQYDLRLPHMPGIPYHRDFINDLFQDVMAISMDKLQGMLSRGDPYGFRWTADGAGGYWICQANEKESPRPSLVYYRDGRVTVPRWRTGDDPRSWSHLCALALSNTGAFWGVDWQLNLYRIRLADSSFERCPPIPRTADQTFVSINNMVADGDDTIWIATQGAGLIRYVAHRGQAAWYRRPGQEELTCITQDRADHNILWMGSLGGGLIRFEKKTGAARALTIDDGLPDNTVYAALQDRKGQLWCSSNQGIFSYDPATGAVRAFNRQDGLAGNEFNRFHFFTLPDGRFCFGGIDGYTVFDPETIGTDTFSPPIVLTSIAINNRDAAFGRKGSPLNGPLNSLTGLMLGPKDNFLTFEFAALEYNNPAKLRYRYRLRGLNEEWIEAGTTGIATYTSIPPGDYQLEIMATNAAGIWNKEIRTLAITILPPFWRTWWFGLLCLGVVALAVWMIFRARVRKVHHAATSRIDMERATMSLEAEALRAQMNPHFIFNCLNSIKYLIQEERGIQAVSYLTTFAKLIRSQLSNEQHEITLADELEACRLYVRMEALRFGDKVACTFQADPGLDLQSVLVPPLILQPLIENAIWHAILPKEGDGLVTVSVKDCGDSVQCIVEDDGVGRRQSAATRKASNPLHESKGMALIQRRLSVHDQLHRRGGQLEVIDKHDGQGRPTGTRIIITLKKES